MTSEAFDHHFSRHAAMALLKQHNLAAVIEERPWDVDLSAGVLRFGEDISARAGILGSEAAAPNSFLWAWANTQSGFPEAVVAESLRLRALGEELGIPELTEAEQSLDLIDGHRLAMLASGLLEAGGYYRGPFDGGAVFLILPSFPETVEKSALRANTALTQAITGFEVDHIAALEGLAAGVDARLVSEPGRIELRFENGDQLRAHLDEQGRITDLEGTFSSPAA